jgi:hypothetical protein
MSTPTYTSPEAATARQAGLGVSFGPENPIIFKSSGQFSFADIESIEASEESLGCGSQVCGLLWQPAMTRIAKRKMKLFFTMALS